VSPTWTRVEARREAPGARGGGEEIDLVGGPASPVEHGAGRALAELERAAAEPIVQLVDGLVGTEVLAVDEEVAARDVTGLEEAAAALVDVAGQAQQLGLREALCGRGRGHGGDPWIRHSGSSFQARLASLRLGSHDHAGRLRVR
jgi:hypothetical protein